MDTSDKDDEEEDLESASALIKRRRREGDADVSDAVNREAEEEEQEEQDKEENTLDLLREVYMPPPITPPQMISGLEESDDEKTPVSSSHQEVSEMLGKADDDGVDSWLWSSSSPSSWADHDSSGRTDDKCSPESGVIMDGEEEDAAEEDNALWNELNSRSGWREDTSGTTTTATTAASTTTTWAPPTTTTISSCQPSTSTSSPSANDSSNKRYSCGQSTLFGELQTVVFNSLIASLES